MNTIDQTHPASPPLDAMLCFAVYSASLSFNRVYRQLLDRIGLTYPQYLVMMALWQEDGVSVGRLGEQLALETNTMTPLLKRLGSMDLLTRHRAVDDERRVLVTLTEKGRLLRGEAKGISDCLSTAIGMPPGEAAHLTASIRALRDNLERDGKKRERFLP